MKTKHSLIKLQLKIFLNEICISLLLKVSIAIKFEFVLKFLKKFPIDLFIKRKKKDIEK